MSRFSLRLSLFLSLVSFGGLAASEERLGAVAFANSCSSAVQPKLERAIALLHSFWWREGDVAFREVLAQDGTCAIAGWGLATIALGNPFSAGPTPQQAREAVEAIARARAIGAKTERERGYIEAIAAYYDRFAERRASERLLSLSDAFETLAKHFPDDDETQIFTSLYLIATQPPADKTFSRALQGAVSLQTLFAKHPDHPGVAHYLIHAYDFPPIAESGLAAAICYSDIAPSAPHALHMPSHIYTRVGLWKESAISNRRAAVTAREGDDRGDQLHALDYLVYADLQLARDADARAALDEAMAVSDAGPAAAYSRSAIPSRYAIERGDWRAAAALPDPDASKFPFTDAMRFFARAIGAARAGDTAAAKRDATALRRIGDARRAAKDLYWADEVDVQRMAADAWIAYVDGDRENAVTLMRAAADLEDRSEKAAISPGRLIPTRELLGDMLLDKGEPASALAEYEASHRRDPKRFRGLSGAARAAAALGNREKARDYFGRLVAMAGSGDARPEVAEASAYLAAK